jgi:hypothetical protein
LRKIKLVILFIGLFLLPITALAQNISDYLILQDIGSYVRMVKVKDFRTLELKTIPGYTITNNSGVLMGADHFLLDHSDKSYETVYESDVTDLGVEVQVTQHTGGDSDRWLLHELERSFRRGNYEEDMTSARFRNIDGNNVFYGGLGGGHYRWLSRFVVIDISYTDLYKQKPEPIEVVKAYLAKFPSTISNITIDNTHNIQWVKDEIERRLWLCDKWNAQFQTGKTTQADLIYNLDRSMNVFLNYRQKYFGVSAKSDLEALFGYKQKNDIASIQKKLTEYKTWWAKHKNKSIRI